jgi:hypothetical protein
MKISKIDRHDIDRAELLLIRAGHHLWMERKRALWAGETQLVAGINEALESVWAAKRLVRTELKLKRAKAAEALREYFKRRKAQKEFPLAA